jgi:signal peptidase II
VKRSFRLFLIFSILIFIDIISKYLVHFFVNKMSWIYPFYPFGGIKVFDFNWISFSINNVENTGAAWGILSNYSTILFYLRVVIVIGLIIYLFLNKDLKKDLPLILIISGAIGNILDYIFYKKVIDMFHFTFFGSSYGIFNFADALITVGIIWLFFLFLLGKNKKNEN